ncbi:MAG: DUF3375 family protein [Gammaproteobacteria bacterium]|nr:DUF3375 family protein [Gammaproteobacteria bacterium]
MSFLETFARLRRLHHEQAAWKLLRADNAPLILAFVDDLFKESSEISFGQAKTALEAELEQGREQGLWDTQESAAGYLRRWIQAGWLRELDDALSMTDACEVALRFCRRLDERDTHSTASHLRVVREAVRDLAAALSPDAAARTAILQARQAELTRELDQLKAGVVRALPVQEQRERVREVYQLASVLNADFRRIEDEIRKLDQALRVQMVQADASRGDVLSGLLEQEHLLAESDAGRAFQGFFDLLMDDNRTAELREQLRFILSCDAATHLSSGQQQFLNRLMRELGRESDRVFQVRRRTEEGLRSFVESGALNESRAVDRLLHELEQAAVHLREREVNLRTELDVVLPTGSVQIGSIQRMRLQAPGEPINPRDIEPVDNEREPSGTMMEHLHTVRLTELAGHIRGILQRTGPLTVAGLVREKPIALGLEELVAHLRIAKAIGATELEGSEKVTVTDRHGQTVLATIPRMMLHAGLFPERLDELPL